MCKFLCSDWPVMLEVYNHKLLTLIPDMLTTQTPCGSIINKLKRFCLQYLVSMVSQLYMIVFITFFKHEQYQLSLSTQWRHEMLLSQKKSSYFQRQRIQRFQFIWSDEEEPKTFTATSSVWHFLSLFPWRRKWFRPRWSKVWCLALCVCFLGMA